jgi:flagellar hook-basal body complex protein FliE
MNITSSHGLAGLSDARPAAGSQPLPANGLSGFGRTLSSAIEDAREKNEAADDAARNLVLGKDTDIHSTMIALEKADISFQFLMQIRNKIIAAYETVMRTQV